MNKTELISAIAEKSKMTNKEAAIALNATLEVIGETLAKGDSVSLIGFGTFETRERSERLGKNPRTGEEILIPACKAPAFKSGKSLKEKVNA